MPPCYLSVDIPEERIKNADQPSSEYIAVETYIKWPEQFSHEICETKRFGDFYRKGGSEVRYYHLLETSKGIALSFSPDNLQPARFIANLYLNRKLVVRPASLHRPVVLPVYEVAKSFGFSQCRVMFEDKFDAIYSVNCVEFYDGCLQLLGSFRLPSTLTGDQSHSLMQLIRSIPDSLTDVGVVKLNHPHWIDVNFLLLVSCQELMDSNSIFRGQLRVELGAIATTFESVECVLI